MKVGIRKPSVKKYVSAKTTGRINREIKKSVNPIYGRKGMGFINDPKRAAYNKIYNKTTVSAKEIINYNDDDEKVGILNIIINLLKFLIALGQIILGIAIIIGVIYVIFKN